MNAIIDKLRAELINNIDEKTLITGQNFFKEKIKYHGVTIPKVNKIAKGYYSEMSKLSKNEIFNLCEQLWKTGYLEESFVACNWSYKIHEQFELTDIDIFEKWIHTYVNNWASCDTLCNHTIGTYIEMFPDKITKCIEFAHSQNRWVKRAAAVTLIIPARKGLFLDSIFEIADILLLDKDDLVQKGYGWMLKAASEAHQQEVFNYVIKNKAIMPRTSLRYAIEKMPKELKSMAMKK